MMLADFRLANVNFYVSQVGGTFGLLCEYGSEHSVPLRIA